MPHTLPTFLLLLLAATLGVALLLVTGRLRAARAALDDERVALAAREALLFTCLTGGIEELLARGAAALGARHAWLWMDDGAAPASYAWSNSGVDSADAAALRAACRAALEAGEQARLDGPPPTLCARVMANGAPVGVLAMRAVSGGNWQARQLALLTMLARIAGHLLERVAATRAAAAESERDHRAYLGALSHRLRTPMTAVLGFAQILEMDTKLSAEQREFVAEIITATETLLQRLNDAVGIAER